MKSTLPTPPCCTAPQMVEAPICLAEPCSLQRDKHVPFCTPLKEKKYGTTWPATTTSQWHLCANANCQTAIKQKRKIQGAPDFLRTAVRHLPWKALLEGVHVAYFTKEISDIFHIPLYHMLYYIKLLTFINITV